MDLPQWQFGVKPDYLATLVAAGLKTATSSGKCFYTLADEPLPKVGNQHIILDSADQPVAKIELQSVEVIAFAQITEEKAQAEGEGNLADWQSAHLAFFQEQCQAYNLPTGIAGDFEVVYEKFSVVQLFPKTYQQWLTFATATLAENQGNDPFLNPKTDANLLLQAVTKRSKSAIFAFAETVLSEAELKQLATLLARRAKGEPMAYILGEKEFWSLPLKVSPATLIPRPDTERLVELALDWANKRSDCEEILQILDLGTGTGAIALALAQELGDKVQIVAVDREPQAVELAEQNRQALGLNNVKIQQSDWFTQISQKFHLIVSNPPYIDQNDENLTQGDVRFEPRSALVAGQNGLADLQKIIENAPLYLHPNGALMLEHGWQQAPQVQQIFKQNQWVEIETVQDYGGNDRVTKAVWTKSSKTF
ncbi:release factor glutamine methyltransferase [Moraxella cuniculi DSM 21768]|uniref:Release factor glutamine methyltransferase n=1 Tax=Moraxella cuniculi DSM 21768 TaxID=1122245 RepID=A0A1N7D8Y0_9GAMM|nr:peptide chain release factor N(5)-glutamine methyltransferase [Moraxella cuniculi]OOS07913.1 protein-(glutamine-N5) methyltransferase, release factor-specific [Moraxella cuniculi]SIR72268.1 release factor glutamine methyltransferase [Moraxella cuniculi DSM 21768]